MENNLSPAPSVEIGLLKPIERAVDFPEVRLALWLVWFFVGIPMFLLAGTGIWFGIGIFPGVFAAPDWYIGVNILAMGVGGVWGLIAAAVRLANPAPVLATRQTARRFAMAGLLAGIAAGAYPAIQTIVQPSGGGWSLVMWIPPIVGLLLLLATISISPALEAE